MQLMTRLTTKDLAKLVGRSQRAGSAAHLVAQEGRREPVGEGLAATRFFRPAVSVLSPSRPVGLLAAPVAPHLRQAFHVDRRPLALFLRGHRLQQVQRLRQILLNRLARRCRPIRR